MMKYDEGFSAFIALGLWVGSIAVWCYGLAICWKSNEIFWTIFSFAFPPAGFLIGLYNLIF